MTPPASMSISVRQAREAFNAFCYLGNGVEMIAKDGDVVRVVPRAWSAATIMAIAWNIDALKPIVAAFEKAAQERARALDDGTGAPSVVVRAKLSDELEALQDGVVEVPLMRLEIASLALDEAPIPPVLLCGLRPALAW